MIAVGRRALVVALAAAAVATAAGTTAFVALRDGDDRLVAENGPAGSDDRTLEERAKARLVEVDEMYADSHVMCLEESEGDDYFDLDEGQIACVAVVVGPNGEEEHDFVATRQEDGGVAVRLTGTVKTSGGG